jgi:hypothetical protein
MKTKELSIRFSTFQHNKTSYGNKKHQNTDSLGKRDVRSKEASCNITSEKFNNKPQDRIENEVNHKELTVKGFMLPKNNEH